MSVDLCIKESACHLGHGLNICKWNDSPRLSQQSPMEWTHPALSSSLWKPSCLLNKLIEPYEMCVISGEQIFAWYCSLANESGGLYSRSVLAWNLLDIFRVEGKGVLMNWLGVQRFETEPRGRAMPSGLTLSETSMSPLRKWDSFHSLNLFHSEKLRIVTHTHSHHAVCAVPMHTLIPKSIKP